MNFKLGQVLICHRAGSGFQVGEKVEVAETRGPEVRLKSLTRPETTPAWMRRAVVPMYFKEEDEKN